MAVEEIRNFASRLELLEAEATQRAGLPLAPLPAPAVDSMAHAEERAENMRAHRRRALVRGVSGLGWSQSSHLDHGALPPYSTSTFKLPSPRSSPADGSLVHYLRSGTDVAWRSMSVSRLPTEGIPECIARLGHTCKVIKSIAPLVQLSTVT